MPRRVMRSSPSPAGGVIELHELDEGQRQALLWNDRSMPCGPFRAFLTLYCCLMKSSLFFRLGRSRVCSSSPWTGDSAARDLRNGGELDFLRAEPRSLRGR